MEVSRVEQYRECAAKGMSIAATARLCGVTGKAVLWANRKHNLGFYVRPRAAGQPRVMPMLLPHLTKKQASEITFLVGQGYSYRRALEAVNRSDLIGRL